MVIRIKTCLLFITVLLGSACATRDVPKIAKQINEECGFEMQAARTAIRLRDQGKPKSFLTKGLAPIEKDSSRLLIKMHEISEQVYAYQELNEVVYATYHFELCQRELQNKARPASLQSVLPELLKCQQTFGLQSSVESTNCILAGIERQSINQPVNKNGVTDAANH